MMPKILYCIALIMILNVVESADTFCPLPSRFKDSYDFDWESHRNEWSNNGTKTDYFLFTLSWSPTFCASLSDDRRRDEFQCSRSDAFSLIVHGLWPQKYEVSSVRDHPRNCVNEKQLPSTFIKRVFCLMPDEDLIQAEWEKHGSCYFKTPEEYFTAIQKIYDQLIIPDIRSMTNPTANSIKESFISLNSPNLPSSAIYVAMSRRHKLKEIRICYDLDLQFTSCKH